MGMIDRPSATFRNRMLVALLAILLAGGGALVCKHAGATSAPRLVGAAAMNPPMRAYNFRLTDQWGRAVSLASLRGKAVALTFLYTHCPDVCPLMAEKMGQAETLLGTSAKRVALVAVSVDPRGDTAVAVRSFLRLHHLTHTLVYLTGSFETLKAVWSHYYIGTDAAEVNPGAVKDTAASPDLVTHTALVYVIDPQGNIRLFLPDSFAPRDLATDLELLASEARR
jgi:protein SCO1